MPPQDGDSYSASVASNQLETVHNSAILFFSGQLLFLRHRIQLRCSFPISLLRR